MSSPGRNDPCTCGSGKKYKRCCLNAPSSARSDAPVLEERLRFESGSYGSTLRGYVPSILCYRRVGAEDWKEYLCLANPGRTVSTEDEASAIAASDLRDAQAAGDGSSSVSPVASSLRTAGYVSVTDFRRAIEPEDLAADILGLPDDYDPDVGPAPAVWVEMDEQERIQAVTDYHRRHRISVPNLSLHSMLHAIVENQIALGDQAPALATLNRLVSQGLDRHEAIHAIAFVLNEFMVDVVAGDRLGSEGTEAYNRRLAELTADWWRQL